MELLVQKRETLGKKSKILKNQGLIPAELYGHGVENVHLSVPGKDFKKIFKDAGESTVIKLKIQNVGDFNALIHDVSKNALTDEFNHIDFFAVRMDEKIKIRVPLNFIGEAPAVKEKGGILVKPVSELEIEALPADLPHHIEIDLSVLSDIGLSVLASDIKAGSGVKILVEPKTVIATVVEQKAEEEAAPTMSVEDVKVESEEKKKEKEEKKEEEKKA